MSNPWEKYEAAPASSPWEKYGRFEPQTSYSGPLQGVRAGLQGLTFGLSDEVGAALAAIPAAIQTGKKYSEVYSEIQNDLGSKRDAFSKDNPKTALGLEIAGGVMTGGLGGARALSGAGYRNASNLGKAGRISGVGAAEGAVYGAGSADQGERLSGATAGAATGAVLAPVGAGVVNTVGRGLGAANNYASQKLAQTPKDRAVNVLRGTADSIGMSADDAAREMQRLGPDATIADLDDAFAVTARAGMNRQGTMRGLGMETMDSRQAGQQNRLKTAIRSTTGNDQQFTRTLDDLTEARKAKAQPLYEQARQEGLQMTPDLERLLKNPMIQGAYKQGQKWAAGRDAEGNLLEVLHQTKLKLDDQISSALRKGNNNEAGIYQGLKRDLLGEIDAQNPIYARARDEFAGDTASIKALETGRDFLKLSPDEISSLVAGMSKGEKELFSVGAARALGDKLDSMDGNRNATRALLGSKVMRDRLSLIMDDPTDFLRQAGIEEQFSSTRNTLTGNSTTAMQQDAGRALDGNIDSGVMEAMKSLNPRNIISALVNVFTRDTATPEVIDQLGRMMFKQGMSEQEVRKIFTSPAIRRAFGDEYDEIVAPYVRGAIAPAASAE